MKVKSEHGFRDVPVTEVTPENYIVPDGEKNTFHVIIEVKRFDANSGKRLSTPRVQKFGAKAFASARRVLEQQGYTVTILYDPRPYLSVLEAERTKTIEERKLEAKAKADAKRQAEIDAAVMEALAKQAEKTDEIVREAVARALAQQSKETPSQSKKSKNNN